ncbi:ABC transporter substrate-binding protein [Mycolicibacterium smegmatis]|uniref:ABC transporter substrate-binding protein n=1 Tax=Mycolicibacterium smegmatis TaxID=1772 RepID=UPI001E371EFF|nr:extracellular solute-binding protein [Mycolicibacterium smegmatis]UGU31827.1 extracellular solute-binding protein [Mycolicibacterium smegmatis]ULN37575.1 extracellular solute-binding protein [Mycolicibacterium smegmatis]ULN72717.1 extracellular solute-binding protein [Mycolicibacterium smegmatis]
MNKHLAGCLAAAVVLAVSACSGSPTAGNTAAAGAESSAAEQVYEQINALSGDERNQTLLDMAKKDGQLTLYTSNTDMDDVVKAFEDKYGVHVETYRANSETVLQRVIQESTAGYQGADIVETNAGELNAMQQQQLLSPYEGELRDKVRPEGRKDGWTADRFNAFVVGWNSSKVAPGSEPKSLTDLADPQWKGRVGLEIGDYDWYAAMYKYYQSKGMSDDDIAAFFTQLAGNSKITKGHTVMGELLSAGQFDVAASVYSHTVDNAAAKGASVAWKVDDKPIEPVVLRPNGAGLMKSARHPAAAMLFFDFLLTDGQQAIAGANRIGAVPTADDPLEGVETVSVPEQDLLDNPRKWSDDYKRITDSAGQA